MVKREKKRTRELFILNIVRIKQHYVSKMIGIRDDIISVKAPQHPTCEHHQGMYQLQDNEAAQ